MTRQSRLEVDLAAIAHNATVLAGLAGRAGLCAVVKANGYGHGAVPVARAAVAGGAVMLGVGENFLGRGDFQQLTLRQKGDAVSR